MRNAQSALTFLFFPLLLALSAPAQTADDRPEALFFMNGEDRIDLTLDATHLGVLLDPVLEPNEARALIAGATGIDLARATALTVSRGHVIRVPLDGANGLQIARTMLQDPAVLAAAPLLLAGQEPYYLTDEILIRYATQATAADRARLASAHGFQQTGVLGYTHNPGVVVRINALSPLDALRISVALDADPAVEWAIPDFSLTRIPYSTSPNDTLYASQWHLNSTGQGGARVDADIDAPEAWDITTGDPNLILAVVDTGVELAHPDLNLVPGIDVLDDDNDPSAQDSLFGIFTENHATAVSGVATGRGNNGLGITGASWSSRVMPIRFLSENLFGSQPTTQDEADAFNFAKDNGAAVINNSWGPAFGASLPISTRVAIDDATDNGRGGLGLVIFFAAGNSGLDVGSNGYAAYNRTVAVAASTDQDLKASYTNFGGEINFCAPSNGGRTTGISTTDRLGAKGYSSNDYTDSFGGTSSASPLAAGVALLVLSVNPGLTWSEVIDVMEVSADKIDPIGGGYDPSGHSIYYGFGRLNAHAAVLEALSRPPSGISYYGNGTAGTGGVIPLISPSAAPTLGNMAFGAVLRSGLPSSPILLLLGASSVSVPVLGGTLLVTGASGAPTIFLTTSDGNGSGAVGLPIPNDPGLSGASFFLQWIGADPGAPQGAAFTRGMRADLP